MSQVMHRVIPRDWGYIDPRRKTHARLAESSAFHYPFNVLQHGDVDDGVAFRRNQVGELPGLDGTLISAAAPQDLTTSTIA
jgi:hypothetical protein